MGGGHNSPVSLLFDNSKQRTNKPTTTGKQEAEWTPANRCSRSPSSVSATSSSTYSTCSDTAPVLPSPTATELKRNTSPIRYVPQTKALVNLDVMHASGAGIGASSSSAEYSSVKAYMECLTPQSLKCVLVGDSGVGKTSMLTNYTTDKFVKEHTPTIYDKFTTSLSVKGRKISMTLCDTSGSEDFGHLRPLCYPQADVALICFSVVDGKSLENARTKWIREIRRHCPSVPVILVGTHTDKRDNGTLLRDFRTSSKRYTSRTEGLRVANHMKACTYVECSSRYHTDVKSVFDEAISTALELGLSTQQSCTQSKQCMPINAETCTIL